MTGPQSSNGTQRCSTDASAVSFEKGLKPVGANLRRAGVTADHLTAFGVLMSGAAAVAIANGALRGGLLLLVLTAIPDLLDGAVAKASGTARPAAPSSTRPWTASPTRCCSAAWPGTSPPPSPATSRCCPMAVLGASLLISYERAKAEALGFDARGGLMERAERLIVLALALLFDSLLIPVLWVMLVLTLFTAGQRFVKVWRQASATVPARRTHRPLATAVAGRCGAPSARSGPPAAAGAPVPDRAPWHHAC